MTDLRHRIEDRPPAFALVTHYGHVLAERPTREEVAAYYAWHCPIDEGGSAKARQNRQAWRGARAG